jgi:hypothetical protein
MPVNEPAAIPHFQPVKVDAGAVSKQFLGLLDYIIVGTGLEQLDKFDLIIAQKNASHDGPLALAPFRYDGHWHRIQG